jgi:hypothetical protein
MVNLESHNIVLNDIYFMFSGLQLSKSGVISSRTIVTAQFLKDAIFEKIPIINGASGIISLYDMYTYH